MTDQADHRTILEDTLFVALLRPAMMWGVPATGCMLNISGSIIVSSWLGLGSWHIMLWMAVLMPAVHMVMRYAVSQDYNWFRTRLLFLETKAKSGNIAFWGGSSLSPLPRMPKKPAEMPISLGWDV